MKYMGYKPVFKAISSIIFEFGTLVMPYQRLLSQWFFTLILVSLTLFVSVNSKAENFFDEIANKTQSGSQNQFLRVDQAFIFTSQLNDDLLELSWTIEPGYYLYQNQFELSSSDGSQLDLAMPQGSTYQDPYFGEVIIYRDSVSLSATIPAELSHQALSIRFQGCADAGLCYPPETLPIGLSSQQPNQNGLSPGPSVTDIIDSVDPSLPTQAPSTIAERSLIWNVLLFLVIGLGLAFTPCVFPMYPILSSVIAGQQQLSNRRAALLSFSFVQGMAITYTALGLIVASAGLQFQAALQQPLVLGAVALLFVLLSLSMFGVYNLQLPLKMRERLDRLSHQQQGNQVLSVGLMGALSGLIASPCTAAPISGILLYIAQTGDLWLGAIALYALSIGMGIPLFLLGWSGGRWLPKAGAWMVVVKNIFGFAMLSVAIFLLERFLSPVLTAALWGLLFIACYSYLFHQNRLSTFSWQQSLRYVVLTLALGASLLWAASPWINIGSQHQQAQQIHGQFIDVNTLDDLQNQLAIAKQQNTAVLVDFYADWCVACKDFENKTFPKEKVARKLQELVLIRVDVTKTNQQAIELLEHYQILGLPSLLLFSSAGDELTQARISGFMDAEAFYAHLVLNGL
ncbi:protein-disulfide reductase DsbD [Alginatibacterium sediminis]|uniref:Thiol:disulfide interchange protein DsbD n=1 Tax=Alginatibacterium sediminis TaxID=2164068 RepID=A0A420E7L9_9ALTE|nr:protein-disulfide reductase DsbD [Alginatibacterium sediminis]RKF14481.1 protein-disulfide reductase DsbD [Alginatibacterium sediminis]